MHCAVCSSYVSPETSANYLVGCLRGRVCLVCQEGLGAAVGRWVAQRMREAERVRQLTEKAAQLAQEAHARLAAEQLPRGLRVVGGGR